jgi:hypothetical protein
VEHTVKRETETGQDIPSPPLHTARRAGGASPHTYHKAYVCQYILYVFDPRHAVVAQVADAEHHVICDVQIRREAARKRKSEAQKLLWRDPVYRQRQVQNIREARLLRSNRQFQTVARLQRQLERNRQQLTQALQLVPKLEQVVEKLRLEVLLFSCLHAYCSCASHSALYMMCSKQASGMHATSLETMIMHTFLSMYDLHESVLRFLVRNCRRQQPVTALLWRKR